MIKNNFKILIVFVAIFVTSYTNCFSASIYYIPTGNGLVDGLVSYDVMLDTEGQSVNAISGELLYDNSLLDFYSFDTTDSFISNWLTEPKDNKEVSLKNNGRIIFEGITTGGFSGTLSPSFNVVKVGKLFTVNFKPKGEGEVVFGFKDIDLRLNDGLATKVNVKLSTSNFYIPKISKFQNVKGINFGTGRDIENESLSMYTDKDSLVDNGKWFVYFNDNNPKHSIHHFELAESDKYNPYDVPSFVWKEVKSPHVLSHQSLDNFIHLKVLYNDGGFSYFSLSPVYNLQEKDTKTAIIIVLMALLSIIVLIREEKEKSIKKIKTKVL